MKRIFVVAILSVLAVLAPAIAQAQPPTSPSEDQVTTLQIDAGVTSLVYEFDEPISSAMAEDLKEDLQSDTAGDDLGVQPMATYISCGDTLRLTDSNGTMTFGYYCPSGSRTRTVPWGYTLSATVQETVVGAVTEDGMWWWRSGDRQPKQAGHVVPPDYLFHGTFKPVYNGSVIQYQDYMTWRHNIGSGGTATLTIAGEFELL